MRPGAQDAPKSPSQISVMQDGVPATTAEPAVQTAAQGAVIGLNAGPRHQCHELGMSSAPPPCNHWAHDMVTGE